MHIESYDYLTGLSNTPITGIDFGSVIQGQHCVKPMVLKAVADPVDSSVSNLWLYLTDKSSWQGAQYGYYVNRTFTPGIESGSTNLAQNHIQAVDATTGGTPGGIQIGWDTTASYYVWLDVQIPNLSSPNETAFRLFYDHS